MSAMRDLQEQNCIKTGRGGRYNFPGSVEPENTEDVKEALSSVLYWYKKGKGNKVTSDEECENRILEYFSQCWETGQRMTVEKLALALGIRRKDLYEWEKQDNRRGDIIRMAKETIAAYDADMVSAGKMQAVPYIFRAKNYYGMRDQQEIVVEPKNPLGSQEDNQELAEKYVEQLKLPEAEQ